MKKILIFTLLLVSIGLLFGDTLVGKTLLATRAKLFVMDSDSLVSTSTAVTDGVGNAMPFKISSTSFRLDGTDKLEFNGADHYMYSASADNLEIKGNTNLTLNAGTKVQIFSASNYFDTSGNLVIVGDYTGVDGVFSGDVTISGSDNPALSVTNNATVGGTFAVVGTSTFNNAITANGGVTGDVTGDVTSTGTSSFATAGINTANIGTVNASTAVNITGSGTALDVDNNVNIDGSIVVDLTSELKGVVTAKAGVKADNIYEDTPDAGVDIDGLDIKDGSIFLNGLSKYIAFDADDDTYLYGKSVDDNLFVHIGGADDFQYTANTFSALSGSKITTNAIDETTANAGVLLEGAYYEQKDNVYSLFPPDGKYLALVDSDLASDSDPSSNGLSAPKDLYIEGKLEVDGAVFFDANVTGAGTTTLATLEFSGDNPEINPSAQDSADGKNFIVHGGDGGSNGGDLFLDGGSGTTDGDLVLGDRDGNVSINSPLLTPEYKTITCDGGGVASDLTEYINYINATANDTITVADGVEGQHLFFGFFTNATAFDVHIQPASCGWGTEVIIDGLEETCEIIFLNSKWRIWHKYN